MKCSVDKRQEWIESNHPILSVRQQAEILGLNRRRFMVVDMDYNPLINGAGL